MPAALSKITCLRRWPQKLRSGHGAPRSGAAASPACGLRLRPRPPFTPCALARSCWWLMRRRCACELLARWHSAGVSAPHRCAAHLSIAISCVAVLVRVDPAMRSPDSGLLVAGVVCHGGRKGGKTRENWQRRPNPQSADLAILCVPVSQAESCTSRPPGTNPLPPVLNPPVPPPLISHRSAHGKFNNNEV